MNYSLQKNWDNLIRCTEYDPIARENESPDVRPKPIGVSPINFKKIINMCPKLHDLHLQFPRPLASMLLGVGEINDNVKLEKNLIHSISGLENLRSLRITAGLWDEIQLQTVLPILDQLPLLDSFDLSQATSASEADSERLARALHQLTHLEKLTLSSVDAFDGTWDRWPDLKTQSLTHLTVGGKWPLGFINAPTSISAWAPHLTRLDIAITSSMRAEVVQNLDNLDPNEHRYDLPDLKELVIWDEQKYNHLEAFKDCQEISSLIY